MSAQKEDEVDAFLFSADTQLLDLKCFRGDRDNISEDDIRNQIHSAIMQKKMGRAKVTAVAPRPDVSPLNVRDFVASL